MRYIALLRGINVGKSIRVDMKKLVLIFGSIGCTEILTYINSGNVIFDSDSKKEDILEKFIEAFEKEFGTVVPILIKTDKEMKIINEAIPKDWVNDDKQKTDVAFLFPEIDSKETINELPIIKEFIDIRYINGAIFWNVKRVLYNKSHLNKIIKYKKYKLMTVRNVNTVRYLANINI